MLASVFLHTDIDVQAVCEQEQARNLGVQATRSCPPYNPEKARIAIELAAAQDAEFPIVAVAVGASIGGVVLIIIVAAAARHMAKRRRSPPAPVNVRPTPGTREQQAPVSAGVLPTAPPMYNPTYAQYSARQA